LFWGIFWSVAFAASMPAMLWIFGKMIDGQGSSTTTGSIGA